MEHDQLTEALAEWGQGVVLLGNNTEQKIAWAKTIVDAARWARDFPTDEQVEAAWQAWESDAVRMFETDEYEDEQWPLARMRKVLEAVTMIGEEK